jgi:hypothetical protein
VGGQVAEDPEAGIKVMADNDIPPIPIGLLCTCRRRRAAAGAPASSAAALHRVGALPRAVCSRNHPLIY